MSSLTYRHQMQSNPIRMVFSATPWAALGYLVPYWIIGPLFFCIVLTLTCVAAPLVLIWVGLPLLVALAYIVRGFGAFERMRAGLIATAPSRPGTARTRPGFFGMLRDLYSDPGQWRSYSYLVGLFLPLYIVDVVVTAVWLSLLGMVASPIWYRFIPQDFDNGTSSHGLSVGYFPNGPDGPDSWGLFVDSTGKAAVVAVVSLVLWLAANYLLVLVARLHAFAAIGTTAPRTDPLAPARQVMNELGPLVQ